MMKDMTIFDRAQLIERIKADIDRCRKEAAFEAAFGYVLNSLVWSTKIPALEAIIRGVWLTSWEEDVQSWEQDRIDVMQSIGESRVRSAIDRLPKGHGIEVSDVMGKPSPRHGKRTKTLMLALERAQAGERVLFVSPGGNVTIEPEKYRNTTRGFVRYEMGVDPAVEGSEGTLIAVYKNKKLEAIENIDTTPHQTKAYAADTHHKCLGEECCSPKCPAFIPWMKDLLPEATTETLDLLAVFFGLYRKKTLSTVPVSFKTLEDDLMFRARITAAFDRFVDFVNRCAMTCPGGSERKGCACEAPYECTFGQGGAGTPERFIEMARRAGVTTSFVPYKQPSQKWTGESVVCAMNCGQAIEKGDHFLVVYGGARAHTRCAPRG